MQRCAIVTMAALCLFQTSAQADPVVTRSVRSGSWSNATTWEGGKLPPAGARVLIRRGHTVTYDVKSEDVLRTLHIAGTLSFAHDQDTLLNVGLVKIQHSEELDESGFDCKTHAKEDAKASEELPPGVTAACLCCDGKPALLIGTQERPIAVGRTARIRLHYLAGMDKTSCPAIVCCGGRMDLHGAPQSRTWTRLGASVSAKQATTTIQLDEAVTGWKPGDQIIVTTSDQRTATEERTIQSISGAKITLDRPLSHTHEGSGDYRSEVANLSRNVVIESADPVAGRGHVMYHRKSAGSISYTEFRHLGKEGILGRYTLHYHLCGDSMRGSSVIGASFHNSKNRWLTVHGTNYLVVRDCVGYKSVGHGYFLEDGTDVYNVFDRNLACQALEGRPLPDQVLPFDSNEGAGFWWANSHNTFTRNVAVECAQYGFRYEATPRAGVIPTDGARNRNIRFGNPKATFNLVMPVRQPDGSQKDVDIRTLPFVRFEDNESHSNGFWGMNMGLGVQKVGPAIETPFVIRNLKIWDVTGGFGVEAPHVLIEGMKIHRSVYGVRGSQYLGQDYRNVSIHSRNRTIATLSEYEKGPSNRHRQPGWPVGQGDGGARYQPASVEVAKLTPIDKLPPITAITRVSKEGSGLRVGGTVSDDGKVQRVMVNGQEARLLGGGEWEVVLGGMKTGTLTLTASAEDAVGNKEKTPHVLTLRVGP